MANAAEKAEAKRVLQALLEDNEQPAEAYVPPPAPTGLALLACALDDYAGSMPPWWRGLGLLTCGTVAAYLPVSVVVLVALVLPLLARWRTGARLRKANRRVDTGRDPGGRTVRDVTVRARARRAAVIAAAVGVWLVFGSAVAHVAGYSSAAGFAFRAGSAAVWAVVFVPMWNRAVERRGTGSSAPTGTGSWDAEPTGSSAPETAGCDVDDTLQLPVPVRPEVPLTLRPELPHPTAPETAQLPVQLPAELPVASHAEVPPPAAPEVPVAGGYRLPPLALLATGTTPPRRPPVNTTPHAKVITGVLLEHNVSGRVVEIIPGPTVTRHVITLGRGVKVVTFRKLEANLQKALGTVEPITVVDAIPGRDAVAVDVPNTHRGIVTLGDLLRAARRDFAGYALGLGLGFTVDGNPVTADLADIPHLLIAGATGSGKSSELNALLVSLLMAHAPATLGLVLIDPKRVELAKYKRLPHLVAPIARGYDDAISAFESLTTEMDRRYDLLEDAGCRDIATYNAAVAAGRADGEPLRRIVAIVDELADLMLVNKARRRAARRDDPPEPDLEDMIVRILQLARAAGIHLILATQRPSVDVVTGLIKANLPAHLAFAVVERADSMVILDKPGAERLLGKGDALWQPQGNAMHRMQGASVTDREIDAVVAHCVAQADPAFDLPAAPERPTAVHVDPVPVTPIEPPARELVYAAAVAQSEGGLVDKRSIAAATPHMKAGTRDKALTDLADPDVDGRLVRVDGKRGLYRIAAHTPDVDDMVSSGDGAQQ